MSNTRTNDPVLRQIAREFVTIQELPTTDALWSYFNGFDGLERYVNVCLTPDKKAWTARFWFAGKTRTFAVCKHGRESELARFADLCVIRFWKYRTRNPIPSDADTNFGVDRATKDLAALTQLGHPVIDLINRIEKHLIGCGVLNEVPETQRKEKRQTVRSTVAFVMSQSFDEVLKHLAEINSNNFEVVKTLDLFSRKFDAIQKVQDAQTQQLEVLLQLLTPKP